MEDEELLQEMKVMIDFDKDARGSYLFQSTWIESLLNEILSYHFCPDDKKKRSQIHAILIHDLNFSNKIRVFLNIIRSNYPQINKKYPKLKKELEEVRDWRNKFAHCLLDSSVEYIEKKTGKIRYEFYKDGHKQYFEITENSIHKKLNEIGKLHFLLGEIVQIISNGESGTAEYVGSV